jgi:hypothetical protein
MEFERGFPSDFRAGLVVLASIGAFRIRACTLSTALMIVSDSLGTKYASDRRCNAYVGGH